MRRLSRAFRVAALCAVGLPAAACGGGDDAPVDAGTLLPAADTATAEHALSGDSLVRDLGCGACHPGLPGAAEMPWRAPPLGDAGSKYRPSYLFAYLQAPRRVRRDIGATRMPDFHLDEREAVALTLFLAAQTEPAMDVRMPAEVDGEAELLPGAVNRLRELSCVDCHAFEGSGGRQAVDLAGVAYRLREGWVRRYLVAPHALVPGTPMPALFYHVEGGRVGAARVEEPGALVREVAAFLTRREHPVRGRLDAAWDDARRRHAGITADDGAAIFRALDCAGCHAHPLPGWTPGPTLAGLGDRVRGGWLRRYLRAPTAIRPFGFRPGTGSRMPDFRLTAAEADSIAVALAGPAALAAADAAGPTSPPLSAFAVEKAETLLRDELSCLGCHSYAGQGGRVGPPLEAAGRATPEHVAAVIRDAPAAMPGTAMPATLAPERTIELVVWLLTLPAGGPGPADAAASTGTGAGPPAAVSGAAGSGAAGDARPDAAGDLGAAARRGYLSLVDHDPLPPADGSDGEALYLRHCAMCHGERGGGDGYNAGWLPAAPTAHADSAYMSTRPDDVLFDGIHAGGHILGKSHRMPAFGATLSPAEIRALVAYMRRLCGCRGPGWSRDDLTGGGG